MPTKICPNCQKRVSCGGLTYPNFCAWCGCNLAAVPEEPEHSVKPLHLCPDFPLSPRAKTFNPTVLPTQLGLWNLVRKQNESIESMSKLWEITYSDISRDTKV